MRERRHAAGGLLTLLIYGLFALFSLLLVVIGARVYRNGRISLFRHFHTEFPSKYKCRLRRFPSSSSADKTRCPVSVSFRSGCNEEMQPVPLEQAVYELRAELWTEEKEAGALLHIRVQVTGLRDGKTPFTKTCTSTMEARAKNRITRISSTRAGFLFSAIFILNSEQWKELPTQPEQLFSSENGWEEEAAGGNVRTSAHPHIRQGRYQGKNPEGSKGQHNYNQKNRCESGAGN